MFDLNLCDTIIDIGLPAKDCKQYLLVMTPGKTVLQLKPGLHIVLTIAEHASDIASMRILTLNRPGFLQIGMTRGGQILPPSVISF